MWGDGAKVAISGASSDHVQAGHWAQTHKFRRFDGTDASGNDSVGAQVGSAGTGISGSEHQWHAVEEEFELGQGVSSGYDTGRGLFSCG